MTLEKITSLHSKFILTLHLKVWFGLRLFFFSWFVLWSLERLVNMILTLNPKLIRLSLQIGCSLYYMTSWRNSVLPQNAGTSSYLSTWNN